MPEAQVLLTTVFVPVIVWKWTTPSSSPSQSWSTPSQYSVSPGLMSASGSSQSVLLDT